MTYITCKMKVDDEAQEKQYMHLIKLFMSNHWFAHGQRLKVMKEMLFM